MYGDFQVTNISFFWPSVSELLDKTQPSLVKTVCRVNHSWLVDLETRGGKDECLFIFESEFRSRNKDDDWSESRKMFWLPWLTWNWKISSMKTSVTCTFIHLSRLKLLNLIKLCSLSRGPRGEEALLSSSVSSVVRTGILIAVTHRASIWRARTV